MAEELQHLIDRIRTEGVATGEKQAGELVAQAKEKAAAIVADAEKKAAELVAKAQTDADAFLERSKKTLEQAARDLLISIGTSVSDVVGTLVDTDVANALTPDLISQMLLKLVDAYTKTDGDGVDFQAMMSDEDAKAVKAYFAQKYQDLLAKGLDISSDRNIFKGFRAGKKDGRVFHDFTKEAIAESLSSFLRPQVSDIVKKAAAE